MPGEIVRAQLIFRFQAVFGEILRPFLRKAALRLEKANIPVRAVAREKHHQHIRALLHRHLHVGVVSLKLGRQKPDGKMRFGVPCLDVIAVEAGRRNAEPVHLAAAGGIGPHVVRREIVGPDGHFRKFENGPHHSLQKFGVGEQIEGHGGIAEVHGADAAVGTALLGKKEHISLPIPHQLMRRDALGGGTRREYRSSPPRTPPCGA